MRTFKDLQELVAAEGEELGTSDWVTVEQERIDGFADATGDHQWIHVDPERAKDGPFGTTIAHGYLTLSMVPVLMQQVYAVEGIKMGINYGLEKVRFMSPVPSGGRIRLTASDRLGQGARRRRPGDPGVHHRARGVGEAGRRRELDRALHRLSRRAAVWVRVRRPAGFPGYPGVPALLVGCNAWEVQGTRSRKGARHPYAVPPPPRRGSAPSGGAEDPRGSPGTRGFAHFSWVATPGKCREPGRGRAPAARTPAGRPPSTPHRPWWALSGSNRRHSD